MGLAAAIDYLREVSFDTVAEVERQLTTLILDGLKQMPYIRVLGSDDPDRHSGIVTFTMDGVHPHDIASILNEDHICIRAGHHCAQPLMEFTGAGSTARASVYFYNTREEAEVFLERLGRVRSVMGL